MSSSTINCRKKFQDITEHAGISSEHTSSVFKFGRAAAAPNTVVATKGLRRSTIHVHCAI